MSRCERDRNYDLHIQDVLLIGHLMQGPGLTTIELHDPRYIMRMEAVARSRQTPEGLMSALRGDNNTTEINKFLAQFRSKHQFPLDELDPEVDALIESARKRAEEGKNGLDS